MSIKNKEVLDLITPKKVLLINVVPLEKELEVMKLGPNEHGVYHGDCVLIIKKGGLSFSNPLPGNISVSQIKNNNQGIFFHIDGLIFQIEAGEKGVYFSIRRPRQYK